MHTNVIKCTKLYKRMGIFFLDKVFKCYLPADPAGSFFLMARRLSSAFE
jgi:hypothetical protein